MSPIIIKESNKGIGCHKKKKKLKKISKNLHLIKKKLAKLEYIS